MVASIVAVASAESPARAPVASGSPAADLFRTRDDAWIALAPNTPRQFVRLLDVLGLGHLADDRSVFDSPPDPDAPAAFLRAKDPGAVKARLKERIARFDSADLEARLVAATVPVSRVNTLVDFTRRAEREGLIHPITLEDEGVTVRSPGLGFRVTRSGS